MQSTRFIQIFAVFVSCLTLAACRHKPHKPLKKAFYYWKTNFDLTGFEQQKLDSIGCQSLYIRFFDIVWDKGRNEPKPVAVSRLAQATRNNYSYIPVVFITQEVLSQINTGSLEGFVRNFSRLLYEKCLQAKINPPEIQIDCDWTKNTKAKYFRLLELCKQQPFFKDKTLSCTIRLHQLRYPEINGIPPVDKGLLMCYNMGNLKLAGDNNSILDLNVARRYTTHLHDYPLFLDVAFPLFSWSLLYDDKNRFAGILREVTQKDLNNNTAIFEPAGRHLFRVIKDTIFEGYHLKAAAIIRHESCSPEQLYQLAELVAAKLPNVSTLIFYHCDSLILSKYSNDELEKICHSFN